MDATGPAVSCRPWNVHGLACFLVQRDVKSLLRRLDREGASVVVDRQHCDSHAAFGFVDVLSGRNAADLGAVTGWGPLLGARSRVVAAAALTQILVIDTPFFDFKDADGLAHETAEAIALGFAGKAAIHPDQVATINKALTPSAEALSHAHAVMEQNKASASSTAR